MMQQNLFQEKQLPTRVLTSDPSHIRVSSWASGQWCNWRQTFQGDIPGNPRNEGETKHFVPWNSFHYMWYLFHYRMRTQFWNTDIFRGNKRYKKISVCSKSIFEKKSQIVCTIIWFTNQLNNVCPPESWYTDISLAAENLQSCFQNMHGHASHGVTSANSVGCGLHHIKETSVGDLHDLRERPIGCLHVKAKRTCRKLCLFLVLTVQENWNSKIKCIHGIFVAGKIVEYNFALKTLWRGGNIT